MKIITDVPIAEESLDHKEPLGAILDPYNRPEEFWKKFREDFVENARVLDLGTGTGTIVSRGVEAGYDVYGIDGTDACLKQGCAAWEEYYDTRLFLANLSEPFLLTEDGENPVLFDVIVSFDVLEHLKVETLDVVIQNISSHLKEGGMFLSTIANDKQEYHVTCKPREWWIKLFSSKGYTDQGQHDILNVVRTDSDNNKHVWLVKD